MIVVRTPLRLSFNGGGTDFEGFYKLHGGAVLSATINKSIYIIIRERFDDMIYLNWSKKEIVTQVIDVEHELIREAMRLAGVEKGVEITTLSDVPSTGSGLGSSSSITVGLLHALYVYRDILVSAAELADQACQIEIDILGKPIGRQDQYAAAFGGFNLIEFSNSGINTTPIKLSRTERMVLSEHLMLFHTDIIRSSNDVLSKQKAVATSTDHSEALKEKAQLAYSSKQALEMGALTTFGELIGAGWETKRKLNPDTSSLAIDKLYQKAKNLGALSGKIVGAGGGGFMLLFVPLDKKGTVRAGLGLRELAFEFTEYGSKVIFDYREV